MIRDGDMAGVRALIQRLGVEVKQLMRTALEIAYFSRGSISYHEVLQMSAGERCVAF